MVAWWSHGPRGGGGARGLRLARPARRAGEGTAGNEGGTYTGSCVNPEQGCPCSSDGATVGCGTVDIDTGDYVGCTEGTRTCAGGTWGACVGDVHVFKSLHPQSGDGIVKHYNLQGTPGTDAGVCASNPCDPTCTSYTGDNSTGVDGGLGLAPDDAGGWTLPPEPGEGGTCVNLQCLVKQCAPNAQVQVTGKVYDPAAIDPVYNAVVMVPNGGTTSPWGVTPIPAGVSSAACDGAPLPKAVTYTYTGTDGSFTLSGVPVGTNIPIVIQTGRWRRMITINTSALTCGSPALNISANNCAGTNNYSGSVGCLTRLPRTQACDTVNDPACVVGQQNIPLTAIATGALDAEECMYYRIGVSSTEYTDELGSGGSVGRVNIFNDGGSSLASPNVNHDLSYLMGFPCSSGKCPTATVTYSTGGMTNPSFETLPLLLPPGWTTTTTNLLVPVVESTTQAKAGEQFPASREHRHDNARLGHADGRKPDGVHRARRCHGVLVLGLAILQRLEQRRLLRRQPHRQHERRAGHLGRLALDRVRRQSKLGRPRRSRRRPAGPSRRSLRATPTRSK